jgi:hypothetical protein
MTHPAAGPRCDWSRERPDASGEVRCDAPAKALVMVVDTGRDAILDQRNLCSDHTRETRQANDRPGRRVDIFPLA